MQMLDEGERAAETCIVVFEANKKLQKGPFARRELGQRILQTLKIKLKVLSLLHLLPLLLLMTMNLMGMHELSGRVMTLRRP